MVSLWFSPSLAIKGAPRWWSVSDYDLDAWGHHLVVGLIVISMISPLYPMISLDVFGETQFFWGTLW